MDVKLHTFTCTVDVVRLMIRLCFFNRKNSVTNKTGVWVCPGASLNVVMRTEISNFIIYSVQTISVSLTR